MLRAPFPPQGNYCIYSTLNPNRTCGFATANAACGGYTALPNGTCQGLPYAGWVGGTSCPAHSTGTSICFCDTGFAPDPAGTSCIVPVPAVACTVTNLTPLPADDACAQSLDNGRGVDVDNACPKLSDAMNNQMQCFANKMAAINSTMRTPIPYSGPTAKYRNAAYQAHLLDIWNKMIELNKPKNRNNETCQSLRAKVIAEKGCDTNDGCADICVTGSHCIRHIPATSSNHTKGTAFDVPNDTINGLLNELTPLPPAPMTPLQTLQAQQIWIADWLAKPMACNLVWGGSFINPPGPDFVHFQLH